MSLEDRIRKVLFVLGIAILCAIPFWLWLDAPHLLGIPKDFTYRANVISSDNFYNVDTETFSGEQYSQNVLSYETVSSSSSSSIIKNSFEARTTDGTLVFAVDRLYGIDRKTGKQLAGFGGEDREGYLFAPAHLKEGQPFTYWHVNYDGPANMQFAGVEYLYGLKVFRYQTWYDGVRIDQTSNLTNLPGVGETLGVEVDPYLEIWVEPTTGRLIDYRDDSIAYFYDLKTGERIRPWNHFVNTLSETSVQEQIQNTLLARTRHLVVEIYIPILFGIFGVGLLMFGELIPFYRSRQRFKNAAIIVSTAGMSAVSTAVLVAWQLQIEIVLRVFPFAAAMSPITAISILFLNAAIIFKLLKFTRVSEGIGAVLVVVAATRILNFIGILQFDIDSLLFTKYAQIIGTHTSMFTSIGLGLLGVSMLLHEIRAVQKVRFVSIAGATVSVLACVGLLGYFFEGSDVLSYSFFFAAAFHTALLLGVAGVVVFVVFHQHQADEKTANGVIVYGMLLLAILVTVAFTVSVERAFAVQARTSFHDDVDQTSDEVSARINIYINALEATEGLLTASDYVSRDEWKLFVDELEIQAKYPGIQGIGFSEMIQPEDLNAYIESIREQGFPDFTVYPAGKRDIYSSITYLEPFDERNQKAFGFDMFSEPTRRSAMEQARDSGQPQMSGRITLVQEIDTDVQPGFIIYVPYYGHIEAETVAERRERIQSYVYAAFRARNFVEGIIGGDGIKNVALNITDRGVHGVENVLYDDSAERLKGSTRPRFTESRTVFVAGRPWELYFKTTEFYGETLYSRIAPFMVLTFGLGASMLIALVFHTILSSRQKAIEYADVFTADLVEAQKIGKFGSFSWNLQTNTVEWSDESFRIHGWAPAKDHVPPSLPQYLEVIHEQDRPAAKKMLEHSIASRHESAYYYRAVWPDKTLHWVHVVSRTSFDDLGRPLIIKGTFQDVTKDREIDQAKTEFVSLASHQLRTPLSMINWYSEMLLAEDAGKLSDMQHEYVKEIFEGNHRMVDLVNSLLNVSRLELGTFIVEPVPTDLYELIQSTVKEQLPTAGEKKIDVQVDATKEIGIVSVDPQLMRMVVQNLVSNAIKYTDNGGKVVVTAKKSSTGYMITVADNGWGIPQDQQAHIFTKLFRADNVKERDTVGTGLGLYLVKTIMDNVGGSVRFESEIGKGTTFFVSLPLEGMRAKEGTKRLDA